MKAEDLIKELKKNPKSEIRLAFYEENGEGKLRDSDKIKKVEFNKDNGSLYLSN